MIGFVGFGSPNSCGSNIPQMIHVWYTYPHLHVLPLDTIIHVGKKSSPMEHMPLDAKTMKNEGFKLPIYGL